MDTRTLQQLLAAASYYAGGLDGDFGPKTFAAMLAVEAKHADGYTFDPTTTTEARRHTACAQACLEELGHAPGTIDGWVGANTTEALNAFLFQTINGKPEEIERAPLPNAPRVSSIPSQSEVDRVYGTPGAQIKSRLTMIELPFKLRIDYNLRQSTNKITVHRDCAPQLEKALIEVRDHYGAEAMRDLGIDRYAGTYNHRKMRGGSKWSMHAYGCAIDFHHGPNGLRTPCPQALFCGPDYKAFLDIMEANEWLPAIRLWGKDAMHFQRATL